MFDSSILKMINEKSEKGMTALMEQYTPLVYSIVKNKLSYVCTNEDIEETVNDVFFTFYKNRDKIDLKKGSLQAYLCTISKSKAIDKLRSANRHKEVEHDDEHMLEIPDNFDLQNEIEFNELQHKLIEAINSLGEPDSTIVYRRYFLGESSAEIGTKMNMKDYNVRQHLSRALRRIEHILKGDYFDEN